MNTQKANNTSTVKPGWKTTEFWLSLLALLLSAAYIAGLVPDSGPWAKIAAFGAIALTLLGYNVSRGVAKTAIMLLAVTLSSVSCVTALKSDKIVSIKQRTFGIQFGENPTTQTPDIRLGLITTVYQLIPTSTNGPVNAPRFFDAFAIEQTGNPFRFSVNENTGAGEVMVGTNATGAAIVPRTQLLSKPVTTQ